MKGLIRFLVLFKKNEKQLLYFHFYLMKNIFSESGRINNFFFFYYSFPFREGAKKY